MCHLASKHNGRTQTDTREILWTIKILSMSNYLVDQVVLRPFDMILSSSAFIKLIKLTDNLRWAFSTVCSQKISSVLMLIATLRLLAARLHHVWTWLSAIWWYYYASKRGKVENFAKYFFWLFKGKVRRSLCLPCSCYNSHMYSSPKLKWTWAFLFWSCPPSSRA